MSYMYIIQVILAALVVFALIGVLFLALKKISKYKLGVFTKNSNKIHIEEIKMLDHARRLVLVRSGAKEYLILLGMNAELLIDSYANNNGMDIDAKLPQKDKEYETT